MHWQGDEEREGNASALKSLQGLVCLQAEVSRRLLERMLNVISHRVMQMTASVRCHLVPPGGLPFKPHSTMC